MSNLVFSSTCSGYEKYHPRMTRRHRVAGLPMIDHGDCRLLLSMIHERMKVAQGDELDRLRRWQWAISDTKSQAVSESWPGWDE